MQLAKDVGIPYHLGDGFVTAGGAVFAPLAKLRLHSFYHGSPLTQKVYFTFDPALESHDFFASHAELGEGMAALLRGGLRKDFAPAESEDARRSASAVIINRSQQGETLILDIHADGYYVGLFARSLSSLIGGTPESAWAIALKGLRFAPYLWTLLLPDGLPNPENIKRVTVRIPEGLISLNGGEAQASDDALAIIGEREIAQ